MHFHLLWTYIHSNIWPFEHILAHFFIETRELVHISFVIVLLPVSCYTYACYIWWLFPLFYPVYRQCKEVILACEILRDWWTWTKIYICKRLVSVCLFVCLLAKNSTTTQHINLKLWMYIIYDNGRETSYLKLTCQIALLHFYVFSFKFSTRSKRQS